MSGYVDRVDPSHIVQINELLRQWCRQGETVRPVAIDRVAIEVDARDVLLADVDRRRNHRPVLVVADHTSMMRRGEDLKAMLQEAMAARFGITYRELPFDHTGPFHADLVAARRLSADLDRYGAVVSIGSGSITDAVKYARHLAGEASRREVPFICFPTAASVTAYTSALAVLNVDGVKRTLPARAPDSVICDLQTLADAPLEMTRAGFGDVLARSVSYGDWYVANQLGMDDTFSMLPGKLLGAAEQRMLDHADHIGTGAIEASRWVTEANLLGGMAMSIVRQTAPLSGWEHAMSHYLDLVAACRSRPGALHGAQVGAATLVAARAYEHAWDELDFEQFLRDQDPADERRRLNDCFAPFNASDALLAELWRDYDKKRTRWLAGSAQQRQFVQQIRAGGLKEFMRDHVRTSADIKSALTRAGAPVDFTELQPAVPNETAMDAVRCCHFIRARFTLGDLLDRCGWLTDEHIRALLAPGGNRSS